MPPKKSVDFPTTVRFTPILREKLRHIATFEKRTISNLVVTVMDQWARNHPQYNVRVRKPKADIPESSQ